MGERLIPEYKYGDLVMITCGFYTGFSGKLIGYYYAGSNNEWIYKVKIYSHGSQLNEEVLEIHGDELKNYGGGGLQ